jgi:2-haloacid dehalogenase
MKYKWILFDADGTLYDFEQASESALERSLQENGLPYEPANFGLYRQINQKVWEAYERGEIQQQELRPLRFQRLFDALDLQGNAAKVSEDYLDRLSENSQLLPGAAELVRSLVGKIKLMIITNGFSRVQRPRIGRSEIRQYFEDMVISDEVGSVKPEAKIFDIAFEKMGKPRKEEVIIIGDSLSSDMSGGIRYGIDTCWYNQSHRRDPAGMEITYEVAKLEEVPEVLNRKM